MVECRVGIKLVKRRGKQKIAYVFFFKNICLGIGNTAKREQIVDRRNINRAHVKFKYFDIFFIEIQKDYFAFYCLDLRHGFSK